MSQAEHTVGAVRNFPHSVGSWRWASSGRVGETTTTRVFGAFNGPAGLAPWGRLVGPRGEVAVRAKDGRSGGLAGEDLLVESR